MPFVNTEVDLQALPAVEDVVLQPVDDRYPRVVLGVVVAVELAVLLAAGVVLLIVTRTEAPARAPLDSPGVPLIALGVLLLAAALAWYAHKAASVIRYAVRNHDVIVRTGVFWRRETIQPIRRIQHVEQLQGPVLRHFGLANIKLFSAGTAHSTFEIPGLQAQTAAQVRQSLLNPPEAKRAQRPSPPGKSEAGAGDRPTDDHA